MAYTVGDLYMNFWWAGVIVGSFILGVVYRAAHLYCIERTRAGEIGVFIYVALFLSLVAIEWDLSTIVFNVLKSLIVVAGIIWFMRLRLSTADVRWVPARGGTRG
jgi:hypothetical protein